jgi:D-2-hydroxyacid dehydrogenase (NADP+)
MAALRSLLIFNGAAAVYAQAVRARFPALHVRETTQRDEALRVLAGGEADALVVSGPWVDDAMLQAGRTLRWIHALTSGSDTITGSAALAPHAVVTTSRGAHGPQMAELALLMMMALARDLPGMLRNQREGAWTAGRSRCCGGATPCSSAWGTWAANWPGAARRWACASRAFPRRPRPPRISTRCMAATA